MTRPQDDWKAFRAPTATIDTDALARAATRFDRQILRRNLVEVGGAAFAVLLFGSRAIDARNGLEMLGSLMVALAAVFVAVTLVRRGHHRGPAMDLAPERMRAALRDDLERQATLLEGVRDWYLAPFVPGLVLLAFEPMTRNLITGLVGGVLALGVVAGFFIFVDRLNRRAARDLRDRIALLD